MIYSDKYLESNWVIKITIRKQDNELLNQMYRQRQQAKSTIYYFQPL